MTNPTTVTAKPGVPFVDVVREFEATPLQLWKAQTDTELIKQWLGPRELKLEDVEYDVRVGGQYRYTNVDDDGNRFGFRGVFHTVEPGVLSIQTWEWDGAPGQATLETARYEDLGGRTRLTIRTIFPTVEARDMTIQYGMEHGLVDSMDRLDEVLEKLGE